MSTYEILLVIAVVLGAFFYWCFVGIFGLDVQIGWFVLKLLEKIGL